MLTLSTVSKSTARIKICNFMLIFCYDHCPRPNNSVFKVNSHKKQNFNTSPSQVQVCWGRSECFGCLTLSEAHTRPPTARPYICHFSPQMYFWAQFSSTWKRVNPQVALSTLRTRIIFIQSGARRIKPLQSYQFEQVCDFAKQDGCSTFSFHNRGNKRGRPLANQHHEHYLVDQNGWMCETDLIWYLKMIVIAMFRWRPQSSRTAPRLKSQGRLGVRSCPREGRRARRKRRSGGGAAGGRRRRARRATTPAILASIEVTTFAKSPLRPPIEVIFKFWPIRVKETKSFDLIGRPIVSPVQLCCIPRI